jgi:acetyltransferase
MSCGGEWAMARYPDILIQYVNWCGNRLLVRPVRPDDAPKFVTASLSCSAADLRFRFLSSMHHLSEKLAAQLTQIDYEQHMAFVAENLKGEIVAVARFARDALKKSAECAVIVRTDLQRRGLGSQMHGLIEDYAVSCGITELWGVVSPDNLRALEFFRRLDFRVGFHIDFPFMRIAKSLV